jgi:signal transduction histidine kinase
MSTGRYLPSSMGLQNGLNFRLEVIDNGSGIVGGDSIFDAFVTTKSKGMGIGLAVSRSIIEAHEGHLTAANNEGYGATFSVVLPV